MMRMKSGAQCSSPVRSAAGSAQASIANSPAGAPGFRRHRVRSEARRQRTRNRGVRKGDCRGQGSRRWNRLCARGTLHIRPDRAGQPPAPGVRCRRRRHVPGADASAHPGPAARRRDTNAGAADRRPRPGRRAGGRARHADDQPGRLDKAAWPRSRPRPPIWAAQTATTGRSCCSTWKLTSPSPEAEYRAAAQELRPSFLRFMN